MFNSEKLFVFGKWDRYGRLQSRRGVMIVENHDMAQSKSESVI